MDMSAYIWHPSVTLSIYIHHVRNQSPLCSHVIFFVPRSQSPFIYNHVFFFFFLMKFIIMSWMLRVVHQTFHLIIIIKALGIVGNNLTYFGN